MIKEIARKAILWDNEGKIKEGRPLDSLNFKQYYDYLTSLRGDVMKWAKPMQLARQPELGGVLHSIDEFLCLTRADGRNLKVYESRCVLHLSEEALVAQGPIKRYMRRKGLKQKTKHYRVDRFDVAQLTKDTPAIVGIYLNVFHELLAEHQQ